MKQFMVLAKRADGTWEHLVLWDEAGEDDPNALVNYETAAQVAIDWTAEHGVQCRVVSVVW